VEERVKNVNFSLKNVVTFGEIDQHFNEKY
jgi:hypothetical protein